MAKVKIFVSDRRTSEIECSRAFAHTTYPLATRLSMHHKDRQVGKVSQHARTREGQRVSRM